MKKILSPFLSSAFGRTYPTKLRRRGTKSVAAVIIAVAFCASSLSGLLPAQARTIARGAAQTQAAPKFRRGLRSVKGRYVVVFNEAVGRAQVSEKAKALALAHGGRLVYVYEDALKGFAVEMPEAAAVALSNDPAVESVAEDGYSTVLGTESTPQGPTTFWGLDRIDQFDLPLDNTYHYNRVGSGVHVYVLDTGIWVTHQDFGTRANVVFDSFGGDGIDRNNHGTFVAGIIGGKTYGVAKNAQLHAVKVCDDNGLCPDSSIIAGLNWVIGHHVKPAVVNMSFGQFTSQSATYPNVDNAVRNAVAAGVTCVAGAGNNSVNASSVYPAHVSEALTVGATSRTDARAFYSNYGTVVDIYAPGGEAPDHYIPVPSSGFAYGGRDDVGDGFTGTSAAAPHVAGVAALYLESYSLYSPNDPAAQPFNVAAAVNGNATPNRISGIPSGPNRLLFSMFMAPPATNPIDDQRFFVRQQYYDVLRRQPEQSGWDAWFNYIDQCGGDAACLNQHRITTARGFFESAEFRNSHPALRDNPVGSDAYDREYVRQLYICYLQRKPDEGDDVSNNPWFLYIRNHPGDYDSLVGGFINSTEYRELRFK